MEQKTGAASHIGRWMVLIVLFVGLSGEVCVEERVIDVVVGANIITGFQARGQENIHYDHVTIDLVDNGDIDGVLEDNAFSNEVVGRVQSIFYRVTKPDAGAQDRTITGTVSVDSLPLIDYQSLWVNDPALAEWTPATPSIIRQDGIDHINDILEDYFTAVFLGTTLPDTQVDFEVSGTSTPQGVETNFDWEIRVTLILVGKTAIDVVDPL